MKQEQIAISVEEAGKLLGLGRVSAYRAAQRGDLPVVQIGKRKLVSVIGLNRMMDNASSILSACNCKCKQEIKTDPKSFEVN